MPDQGSPESASIKPKRVLRTGFSTGTAAAAAAQAALAACLTGAEIKAVKVRLPGGKALTIAVKEARKLADGQARALVVKDGGDDPDVTNGAVIGASVKVLAAIADGPRINLRGGPGVGRVTRPGLVVEPGQPAINPVPRKMIIRGLSTPWKEAGLPEASLNLEAEIFVERGEELARQTLNPRLGILGGLSILGTTGLVKPFSHEAYVATIESSLQVARSAGLTEAVLTTGGQSEAWAMKMRPDLPALAFIQVADFFGEGLSLTARAGFQKIGLVSFFGKAVKQAAGHYYTHAHQTVLELPVLAGWLREAGLSDAVAGAIAGANTAREALEYLRRSGDLPLTAAVAARLARSARKIAGPAPDLWLKILDFNGQALAGENSSGRRP